MYASMYTHTNSWTQRDRVNVSFWISTGGPGLYCAPVDGKWGYELPKRPYQYEYLNPTFQDGSWHLLSCWATLPSWQVAIQPLLTGFQQTDIHHSWLEAALRETHLNSNPSFVTNCHVALISLWPLSTYNSSSENQKEFLLNRVAMIIGFTSICNIYRKSSVYDS